MQIDARLLKQERRKRAWSQEHLATVAGLGLRTVQRIESSGSASNESIASIATVLDMRVADFVSEARKPTTDFSLVRAIGTSLPGVSDASTRLGGALKFRGRLLACEAIHKSAEPDSLMVSIGRHRRAALLKQHPGIYYLTDHYVPYPAILVRLARINRTALRALLSEALEFVRAQRR